MSTVPFRLLLVVLAAWTSLSVGLALAANSNFRTVDRILEPGYRAEHDLEVGDVGHDRLRMLYRYLAGELNRRLFREWAVAQTAMALLLAVTLFVGRPDCGRAVLTLALSGAGLGLVLALALTPMMLRLGPPFDFLPRPVPAEFAVAHRRFLLLHGLYFGLDLLKVLLLLVAFCLALSRRRRLTGSPDAA